jgi:hypothetical protein
LTPPCGRCGTPRRTWGIINHRYGQIPESEHNPERLSLTELEFREARRLGRPMLIFIMGPNHAVLPAAVERDPEKRKLDAFREDVKRATADSPVHRVYREFNDLTDFSIAATQSVAELRRHLDARSAPAAPAQLPDAGEHDGIPDPPQLYAEPRYIGSHAFVGRVAQLATLDDWAAPAEPHTVLLFVAALRSRVELRLDQLLRDLRPRRLRDCVSRRRVRTSTADGRASAPCRSDNRAQTRALDYVATLNKTRCPERTDTRHDPDQLLRPATRWPARSASTSRRVVRSRGRSARRLGCRATVK